MWLAQLASQKKKVDSGSAREITSGDAQSRQPHAFFATFAKTVEDCRTVVELDRPWCVKTLC
jgi:phage tail tube protein FII